MLSQLARKHGSQLIGGCSRRHVQQNLALRFLATGTAQRSVEKTNWKEDIVYLYQFPRSPYLANISPFCLKVEAFLRVHNLKYEVISSYMARSSRGKLPFIELNGEQIADSQVILWRLQKHFGIEDPVSGYDRGAARALERMVEMSTLCALNQDRVVKHADLAMARNVSGIMMPAFLSNFLAKKMSAKTAKVIRATFHGLTEAEIKEVLRRDIQAIADVLDDKKFLFGDRMTVTDCAVFGQLATAYYLPFRQQITDLLDDEHPRVRKYLDRIRAHYFQDWKRKDEE